jgi:hypothetical protein
VATAFIPALSRANRLDVDVDAGGRLHLTGPGGEIALAKLVEG